jgi:hypothetical protein
VGRVLGISDGALHHSHYTLEVRMSDEMQIWLAGLTLFLCAVFATLLYTTLRTSDEDLKPTPRNEKDNA